MNIEKILYKIKNKEITEKELLSLNCDDIQKVVLLYAFYEINNLDFKIQRLLKEKKREWIDDSEKLAIIKKLLERSKQKALFFDITFFINCEISQNHNTINLIKYLIKANKKNEK